MFENPGIYAVLLGSGVSRSAGILTGWEITLELVRRAGIAAGAGEQDYWHRWYVEQREQQPNYSTLLEGLKNGKPSLRAFLNPPKMSVSKASSCQRRLTARLQCRRRPPRACDHHNQFRSSDGECAV